MNSRPSITTRGTRHRVGLEVAEDGELIAAGRDTLHLEGFHDVAGRSEARLDVERVGMSVGVGEGHWLQVRLVEGEAHLTGDGLVEAGEAVVATVAEGDAFEAPVLGSTDDAAVAVLGIGSHGITFFRSLRA